MVRASLILTSKTAEFELLRIESGEDVIQQVDKRERDAGADSGAQ
jgi:hypothetical protein